VFYRHFTEGREGLHSLNDGQTFVRGEGALTVFRSLGLLTLFSCLGVSSSACSKEYKFVPQDPGRGPGEMAGLSEPINTTFGGGSSPDVQRRESAGEADWTVCDSDCQAYCQAQPFENPVDEAICPYLWGAGYDTRPVDDEQACRRLFADLRGEFPTYDEIEAGCLGRPVSNIVEELIEGEAFVFQNQRRWADRLRYNNVAVNLERIYDADILVGKMYRGLLRYDHFIEVISAHPVLTRRFDNANDRAEALFNLFVGRPPFENERADMSKLYTLWSNGYYDHPELGIRLPDSFIEHRCIDEQGKLDENTAGACTSVLWGHNRVVLEPDYRAHDNLTWNNNLTEAEWKLLQTPGRIVGTWPVVWEHAVEQVLETYLGYDLSKYTPTVAQALVEYVLSHGGDIRAAHYAVLTSQIYLQSTECAGSECAERIDDPPWTYGPFRQAEAELWIDSIGGAVSSRLGACDHRIPDANQLLEDSPIGYEVIAASRWTLDEEAEELRVDDRYANFAQTLGGCPDNQVSGRFTGVSILSTATQEAFVSSLCNPSNSGDRGVEISRLLPDGVGPNDSLSPELAEQIADYQMKEFFSRRPVDEEREMARTAAAQCEPSPCDAETFARVSCYALLSSSEMLFY
jgi:hypothetical protein